MNTRCDRPASRAGRRKAACPSRAQPVSAPTINAESEAFWVEWELEREQADQELLLHDNLAD